MAKKKPDVTETIENSTLGVDLTKPPETPAPETVVSVENAPPPDPPVPETPTPPVGRDEPAPQVDPLIAEARRRGYDVDDDASPEDFWGYVQSQEEAAAKQADYEKRIAQYEAMLAQRQETTAPPPQPKASAEEARPTIPPRPELDENVEAFVQFGAQRGLITAGPGGLATTEDPSLRAYCDKYNQWKLESARYDREWTADKIARVQIEEARKADREQYEKLVDERVAQRLAERDGASLFDNYKQQHADWLYADESRTAFTAEGQLLAEKIDSLVKRGFTPEEAVETAQALVLAQTGKAPWKGEAEPPKDTPQQRTSKFRSRLNSKANGTAKQPLPTAPVNRPAAVPDLSADRHATFDQKSSSIFQGLLAKQVAERM